MQINDVLNYFDQIQNEKLKKINSSYGFSILYGIRIQALRDIATQIGFNHALSLTLSSIDSYETVFLSVLIEDPTLLDQHRLTFLAKASRKSSIVDQALSTLVMKTNQMNLINSWFSHEDSTLRYSFYAIYSTLLRKSELDKIDINFSLTVLARIKETLINEDIYIQNAMNNLVVMAGLHVPLLVEKAYEIARHIGHVLPTKAKNSCNIQSALDYLNRYIDQPKYSRVAQLKHK